jgi:cytoskeletal protein RodZ
MMMATISTLCLLVSLFGLIMIVISLFTPRTVWFSKNKSRRRGVLTWLAVVILALIVGWVAYTRTENAPVAPGPATEEMEPAEEPQEPASESVTESDPAAPGPAAEEMEPAAGLQEPASEAVAESDPAAPGPAAETAELQESDPEAEALRKAIAARAEEVKPELAALLRELEALRDTPEFRALGFSADNQVAADWKKRVEEVRDRLKGDKGLPAQVAVVPTALLSLGTNYILRNNGAQNNADIEWDSEMIAAGLNWK